MNRVNIISKKDGTLLSVMYYDVENAKGIVQISHGMCEHKERYKEFMRFLGEHGYMTIIHDHRGHGRSVKKTQNLGYFGKNGAEDIVDDVYQVNCWIRQKYPYLPVYLLGHSMGSLVARVYLQKYERTLSGLIVCGSPSYNRFTPLGCVLTKWIEKVKGPYYKSNIIHKLAFGTFNHGIKNVKSEHQWICTNEQIVQEYDQDPLCNFVFTINGYHNLFTLVKKTYDKNEYPVKKENLPIFFISGKEDPCLINIKKFDEAVSLLADVGYKHVESCLYPKMRHEILNETHRQVVFDDIVEFLNRINK